jgi:hypothetical protein
MVVRTIRRWRGRCPWCNTPMSPTVTGIFMNPGRACPNGHYREEIVAGSGIIYDEYPPAPDHLRIKRGVRP